MEPLTETQSTVDDLLLKIRRLTQQRDLIIWEAGQKKRLLKASQAAYVAATDERLRQEDLVEAASVVIAARDKRIAELEESLRLSATTNSAEFARLNLQVKSLHEEMCRRGESLEATQDALSSTRREAADLREALGIFRRKADHLENELSEAKSTNKKSLAETIRGFLGS